MSQKKTKHKKINIKIEKLQKPKNDEKKEHTFLKKNDVDKTKH